MKKYCLAMLLVLAVSSLVWAAPPWSHSGTGVTDVSVFPYQEVDDQEAADLRWMREEEKLARDVYLTLYEKWGLRIFQNISQSEQRHMDSVAALLEKYGIEDPVTDDQVGVFQDPEIASLYEELVAQGETSVEEALKVGATIEDLDLKDLEDRFARTDNEDIQHVYEALECGSRNHLRSFVSQLSGYGITYEPQYISPEEFEEIISGEMEFCGTGYSPYLDVKINGEDTYVASDNDTLTITLSTAELGMSLWQTGFGPSHDLFFWVEMPDGSTYYWSPGQWSHEYRAAYTGPVPLLLEYPFLRVPAYILPKGTYILHFATDLNPDGALDADYFEDTAVLTVQ